MPGRTPLALLVACTFLFAGCIAAPDAPRGDLGPTATIGMPSEHVPVDHPVTFTANDSADPAGRGLTFDWDLGDGTTATGAAVTHTYEATGNHTVRLTVTDANGAEATASRAVQVGEAYVQHVWFNWDKLQLDVLMLGVHDPVVGAAIQEAIDAWYVGMVELLPEFADELEFRVYWPVTGGLPPAGFSPDIFFVPVGFMASYPSPTEATCTAFAPAGYIGPEPGDLDELYFTAAHEFGHCLGLSHVFHRDVEYEPAFDLLGGGSVHNEWGKSCPSNLNADVLRMVFGGEEGTVVVSSTEYHQSAC